MSIRVKQRLDILGIVTTHDERVDIDREIEDITRKYCDEGVKQLTDEKLIEIVDRVRRRKKKTPMEIYA